jgi:hypothetical protein
LPSRRISYFEKGLSASEELEGELAEYPVQAVPLLLSALEPRKARHFYKSDGDHTRAVAYITALQAGLLMGAKRDIIIEIRSARGDYYDTVINPDPDITPVGQYSGASTNDVLGALRPRSSQTTILEVLDDIKVAVEAIAADAQAEDNAALLAKLTEIAALLA